MVVFWWRTVREVHKTSFSFSLFFAVISQYCQPVGCCAKICFQGGYSNVSHLPRLFEPPGTHTCKQWCLSLCLSTLYRSTVVAAVYLYVLFKASFLNLDSAVDQHHQQQKRVVPRKNGCRPTSTRPQTWRIYDNIPWSMFWMLVVVQHLTKASGPLL